MTKNMLTPVEKGRLTRMAKADAKVLTMPLGLAKVVTVFHRDHGATPAVRHYAGKVHDAIV